MFISMVTAPMIARSAEIYDARTGQKIPDWIEADDEQNYVRYRDRYRHYKPILIVFDIETKRRLLRTMEAFDAENIEYDKGAIMRFLS